MFHTRNPVDCHDSCVLNRVCQFWTFDNRPDPETEQKRHECHHQNYDSYESIHEAEMMQCGSFAEEQGAVHRTRLDFSLYQISFKAKYGQAKSGQQETVDLNLAITTSVASLSKLILPKSACRSTTYVESAQHTSGKNTTLSLSTSTASPSPSMFLVIAYSISNSSFFQMMTIESCIVFIVSKYRTCVMNSWNMRERMFVTDGRKLKNKTILN